MVFNEKLANRIRKLTVTDKKVTEQHMFGGLCFLVDRKMFCGVLNDNLVLRLNPEEYEKVLKRRHVRPMDFTRRPMRGFVYVSLEGCKTAASLKKWIEQSYSYALSVKKKPKRR